MLNKLSSDLPIFIIRGDDTESYLNDKMSVEDPLAKTILNAGSDEQLKLSLKYTGSLVVIGGYLQLAGDDSDPGPWKVFGTGISGIKGWEDYGVLRINNSDNTPGYLDDKLITDWTIDKTLVGTTIELGVSDAYTQERDDTALLYALMFGGGG